MEQRKNITTLAQAFDSLSPELRRHSLRVEQYADLIFMELCAAEEYLGNVNSRVRLKLELREQAAEAARFHDVGKALVPDFYQWDSESYSPEEQALYRKHGTDGAQLLEKLLEKQPGATPAQAAMFRETLTGHHERWDGQGWPNRTEEEKTPVLGRIVAVADALDHLLMTTRTEDPVETAVNRLMEGSGTLYDPVIMGLLYEAKRKVEKIFAAHAGQSQAIPKAVRIIRRKKNRPFWLEYRPIVRLAGQTTAAVEAAMCFRRGKDVIDYPQAAHLLREKKAVQDLAMMFLVEAGDTLRRMQACQAGGSFVALNCVPGFLRRRGTATAVAKLAEDTDLPVSGLCLILTEEDWDSDAFGLKENCRKLSDLGFLLMVSGVGIEKLNQQKLQELNVTYCRLPAMEAASLEAGSDQIRALAASGLTLLADGLDTYRMGSALSSLGVEWATGVLPGGYVDENTFISGELAMAAAGNRAEN